MWQLRQTKQITAQLAGRVRVPGYLGVHIICLQLRLSSSPCAHPLLPVFLTVAGVPCTGS